MAQARAQGRPVTLPVDAARYWLVAPSSWSLLLDARQLLQDGDVPDALANLSLSIGPEPLRLLARQDAGAHGWTLSLQKPLGAAKPFALRSERVLTPASWPWAQWLAWPPPARCWSPAPPPASRRAEALRQREQARVAAMERLGTLGEMAAGIAHELNQPLTAILAQTRAAERMLDDEDERPAVREALRASAGRPPRGRHHRPHARAGAPSAPAREALDPEALANSLRFLREQLARQGVRGVAQRRPGERPLGDRVALEQILHNGAERRRRAGRHARRRAGQGLIELSGAVDGDHYLLSVRDNGPGIAPEALPRLYQPFYTTRAQGMGLGLALCETLAGAMDARIEAQPDARRRLFHRAPAARRSPPMTTSPPAHAHAQSPLVYGRRRRRGARRAGPAAAQRRPAQRRPWRSRRLPGFAAAPGHRLRGAGHPHAGHRRLDVLSRLAEQSDLPVIMLTGHANVDLCRRAFKGGAIEFLQNRWTTMCSGRGAGRRARTSPAANDCR